MSDILDRPIVYVIVSSDNEVGVEGVYASAKGVMQSTIDYLGHFKNPRTEPPYTLVEFEDALSKETPIVLNIIEDPDADVIAETLNIVPVRLQR
jgi:hypothetical protein